MKSNKLIIKSLLIAAAALLGTQAFAQTEPSAIDTAPVSSSRSGLLGQTYAGLNYTYINLDDSSVNADSYAFEYNQSLKAGLDGVLSYDWTRSGLIAGSRVDQQALGAALRAYSSSYSWGKPYAEAGVGYAWTKYAGDRDNSFVWQAAVGVEFQLATAFTVTPFVQYVDAPDFDDSGTWNYGVKANYWVTSEWSVVVGADIDDQKNTGFMVGTNFRF